MPLRIPRTLLPLALLAPFACASPSGGFMALFEDPDGNVSCLDEVDAAHG